MFGFLRPSNQDAAYRAVYAHCCEMHHQRYGRLSALYHSYEAVCLYSYALDAGVSAEGITARRCCRLLRRGLGRKRPDAAVGQFTASLSLLLASLKLADDLRDQPAWHTRLLSWLLRRRFAEADRYFTSLDPAFRARVEELVADHLTLEETGQPIGVADYCQPTSSAFGYVFGLMARLPCLSGHQAALSQLGEHVGAAVLAYDCAVDWQTDRAGGQFNPLNSQAEVFSALAYSQDRLQQGAQLCQDRFGPGTRTGQLLEAVASRAAMVARQMHSRPAVLGLSINREPGLKDLLGWLLHPVATLAAGALGPLCGVMSFAHQQEKGCCGQSQHVYYEGDDQTCGRRTTVDVDPNTAVEQGTDWCGNPMTTYSDGCCSTTVTEKKDCCGNPIYEKRNCC